MYIYIYIYNIDRHTHAICVHLSPGLKDEVIGSPRFPIGQGSSQHPKYQGHFSKEVKSPICGFRLNHKLAKEVLPGDNWLNYIYI